MSLDKMVDSVQLDANLTAIADKIREANGTTEQLSFPNDFIEAIDGLGREDLTYPKDVDFIDYDGRLIYSYTVEEFLALTALPANPINKGLIAQGWNWTLADAQEFVAECGSLVIGQSYTTDDGRTRLYICVPEDMIVNNYPTTVSLCLTSDTKGSPTIYWGDGNVSVWNLNANANGAINHTYTSAGNYVIELEVTAGNITAIGREGAHSSVISGSNRAGSFLRKVEIGDNVLGFARNVFQYNSSLETVSIPITVTSIADYDEGLFNKDALYDKGIVFPINLTTNRYRAWWSSYLVLRYISIPKSMKNIQIPTYPQKLRKFTMYSMEPYSGTSNTVRLYSVSQLTHFVLMGTFTNIITDTCRDSFITKLVIPASVTNIAATAFAGNTHLEEVHLKPETPPTLSNTNAFSSQISDASNCIFYVPYSEDHSILEAYKTATNWSTFASKMQEEQVAS